MKSNSKQAAGNKSHKTAKNLFLHYYYTYPYFMLTLCIGQEIFLLKYFLDDDLSQTVPWAHTVLNTFPVWHLLLVLYLLKQLSNWLQLLEAADYYASCDLAAKQDMKSK